MATVDTRIKKLEVAYQKYAGQVPGTSISRAMLDHKLCAQHGVEIRDEIHESETVWCLGLGGLVEPKIFFYDHTILGVVKKAEVALTTGTWAEAQLGFCTPHRRSAVPGVGRGSALLESTPLHEAELARLSAPRPAPRCPKCGSENIEVMHSPCCEPG